MRSLLRRIRWGADFKTSGAPATPAFLVLEDVRRRLELFLAAASAPEGGGANAARHVRIAELPSAPTGWRRLTEYVRRSPSYLGISDSLAVTDVDEDSAVIRLPAALAAPDGPDAALAAYRITALVQAERLARGSAAFAPGADTADHGRLVRDLYHVAESAAAERAIACTLPGVRRALTAARAAALADRLPRATRTGIERDVEAFTCSILAEASGHVEAVAPDGVQPLPDGSPLDSLAWAQATATALAMHHTGDGWRGRSRPRYRGVAPVAHWGAVVVRATAPMPMSELRVAEDFTDAPHSRIRLPLPGNRAREAAAGESPDEAGVAARPARERPWVDDGRGVAGDEEAPQPDPGAAQTAGGTGPAFEASPDRIPPDLGVHYPEWDATAERYLPHHVTVREVPVGRGDPGWAEAVLRAHAPLVRRVRERFEPLRAQRTRLAAQRRGNALDLAACVRATADLRAGQTPDDRFYLDVRPARRPIATVLLVDVSGSTGLHVDAVRKIIDVEREAVLLAGAALDALGDPYAVFAFSSHSAADVRLHPVKRFTEPNGDAVRRRVSALQPGASTRLGAALRHTTALLARQPAGHHLLLLLSDGRPNDDDGYKDRHALEDARRAVLEARAVGVVPFCLTVDREEPEAAAWVFGPRGYTALRRPEQLPRALVSAVAHLLKR